MKKAYFKHLFNSKIRRKKTIKEIIISFWPNGTIKAVVPESTKAYLVIPVIASPLTSSPTTFIAQK